MAAEALQEHTMACRPKTALLLVLLLAVSAPFADASLALPATVIPLDSPQGERMLEESNQVEDYWQLSQHFITQINGAFCGPASAVMVLNALGVARPLQEGFPSQYAYYTQENIFNNDTEAVVPLEEVKRQGMSLRTLALFIAAHEGVQTSYQYTNLSMVTLQQFRTSLVERIVQPNAFVIVNFDRAVITEVGGGHHSPVAAYHAESDSVLVMDVSRYKYPAWWVSVELLRQATASQDGSLPRGLVSVWTGNLTDVSLNFNHTGAPEPPINVEQPLDGGSKSPAGLVAGVSIPLFFAGLLLGSVATWFISKRNTYKPASKHDADEELGLFSVPRR